MTSLAWSSLALLVLLLPGFAALIGLYAPERFARDVTPRNPLAALSAIVLAALVSHLFLSAAVRLHPGPWVVDWPAIVDAVQMAPRGAWETTSAAERAGLRIEQQFAWITAYVGASCLAGFFIGRALGAAVLRGWFHSIAVQHSWVYPLQPGIGGVMTYSHVLTNIGHSDKVMLYRGRLKHFALAANGTFDYVVLAATGQRLLRLDEDIPRLGDIREIGEDRLQLPPVPGPPKERLKQRAVHVLSSPRAAWTIHRERRREMRFRVVWEDRAADRALMMIPGATIRDVVFQGLYQIPNLKRTTSRTRGLRASMTERGDDPRAQLEALRSFRAGQRSIAAPLPVRQVQETLRGLGLDPGPTDGIAGTRTRTAVRAFQTRHGLHPDGDAGPLTSARLREEQRRPQP